VVLIRERLGVDSIHKSDSDSLAARALDPATCHSRTSNGV